MATIHMLLQGKGGVGKSFAAATLAQYKLSKGESPLNIDTDPVNSTFHGYKGLDIKRINLLEGEEINTRRFDDFVELVAESTNDVIVDNGASSFVPMSHYLISNKVPALLAGMGHELIVHTVITGGQAMMDTINGFAHMVRQFPDRTNFIIWLNPYWGAIHQDGKEFEQMRAYTDRKDRIAALVRIPRHKGETYGRDLSDMLQERLTFDEAITMPSLTIMTRQRLKIIKEELFSALANAQVL